MRFARVALVIIAVVCFGVALSYPIRYRLAQRRNDSDMQALSDMRTRAQEQTGATEAPQTTAVEETGATEAPQMAAVDGTGATEAPQTSAVDGTGATEAPRTAAVEETSATEAPDAMPIEAAGTAAAPQDAATTAPISATEVSETAEISQTVEATQPPDEAGTPDDMILSDAIEAAIMKGRAVASATAQPKGEIDAPEDTAQPQGEVDAPKATAPPKGDIDAPEATGAPAEIATARESEAPAAGPPRSDGGESPGPVASTDAVPASDIPMPAAETQTPPPDGPHSEAPTPTPSPTPGIMDLILDYEPWPTMVPIVIRGTPTPDPDATPTPAPTFDIEGFTGALPYPMKEKVTLDEGAILPEMKEIYALNHDLVGWITIPDTVVDYPVVQRPEDSDFYLSHDFYGEENQNGQIILDPLCDPYTPSYNLVISGHHMKNGSMFGSLTDYRTVSFWRRHMFLEFDTLMARKRYVVFAAFYSADYDEDEEGFRYNANVRYRMDADPWLSEIRANQLYDTGIDVKFGDEFITLTTCNRARHRNGRFVVVCRRVREGETFE